MGGVKATNVALCECLRYTANPALCDDDSARSCANAKTGALGCSSVPIFPWAVLIRDVP